MITTPNPLPQDCGNLAKFQATSSGEVPPAALDLQSEKLSLEIQKLSAEVNKIATESKKIGLEVCELERPFWKKKEIFGFFATLATLVGVGVNILISNKNLNETIQRQQAKRLLELMASENAGQRENAGRMLSQLDGRFNYDELLSAYHASAANDKEGGTGKSVETPFQRVGIIEALGLDQSGWTKPLETRMGLLKVALDDTSPLVRHKAIAGLAQVNHYHLDEIGRRWKREAKEAENATSTRRVADGEMVLIPAGHAVIGADNFDRDEAPARQKWIESFWIDRRPVSNAQWTAVMQGIPTELEKFNPNDTVGREIAAIYSKWRLNNPDHSVVGVSHKLAAQYCMKTKGRYLPTEIQWEVASRGRSGWKYPWGIDEAPAIGLLDREKSIDQGPTKERLKPLKLAYGIAIDKSVFGVEWTVSAVRQWTRTAWTAHDRNVASIKDTENCSKSCAVRGSAGMDAKEYHSPDRFRTTRRMPLDTSRNDNNLGFRCAIDASERPSWK